MKNSGSFTIFWRPKTPRYQDFETEFLKLFACSSWRVLNAKTLKSGHQDQSQHQQQIHTSTLPKIAFAWLDSQNFSLDWLACEESQIRDRRRERDRDQNETVRLPASKLPGRERRRRRVSRREQRPRREPPKHENTKTRIDKLMVSRHFFPETPKGLRMNKRNPLPIPLIIIIYRLLIHVWKSLFDFTSNYI